MRRSEDFTQARVRRLYQRSRERLSREHHDKDSVWSMRRMREALSHAERHDREDR